jgi:hypothetical protein
MYMYYLLHQMKVVFFIVKKYSNLPVLEFSFKQYTQYMACLKGGGVQAGYTVTLHTHRRQLCHHLQVGVQNMKCLNYKSIFHGKFNLILNRWFRDSCFT